MAEAKLAGFGLRSYGDVIFNTDGAYDIGKAGATRPRDLFLTRNALVGGTLGVTGVTTLGTLNAGAISGTTIGASGTITGTATTILQGSGKTTGTQFLRLTNTGGDTYCGVESSAGNAVMVGASAYATFLSTANATGLVLGTNGVVRVTLNAAGTLTTFATPVTFGANALTAGAISGTTGAFVADGGANDNACGVRNSNVSVAGRAAFQLSTAASALVWQWFARNGDLFCGVGGVADYIQVYKTTGATEFVSTVSAAGFKVGAAVGVDFGPAHPASITIVKGIVTACS